MKSIVIGASAGLGRALAEELAERGHDLFLVATDKRDLEAIAADLAIRFGRKVEFLATDIVDVPATTIRDTCLTRLGKPDCLFLVSGQHDLERDFEHLSEAEVTKLTQVNFSAPVRIALAFLPSLLQSPHGNCVGIGSAAQARARSKNTVYGASKLALEFFFGGLRQKLIATNCRVQYYRMGYMATGMTFGRKSLVPNAKPADVAQKIVAGLGRDHIGAYLPRWWAPLMLVYRALPQFIFGRLKI